MVPHDALQDGRMHQSPSYPAGGTQRSRPMSGFLRANASPSSFGTATAQAAQEFGKNIQGASNLMLGRAGQMQAEDNAAAELEAKQALWQINHDIVRGQESGILTRQGKSALGASKEYHTTWTDKSTEYINTVQNANIRPNLEAWAVQLGQSGLNTVSAHEVNQRKAYQASVYDGTMAQLGRAVAQSPHDNALFQESVQTAREAIDTLSKAQGWSPEETAARLESAVDALAKTRWEAAKQTHTPQALAGMLRPTPSDLGRVGQLIQKAESGGDYEIVHGGNKAEQPITQMTVAELLSTQTSAMGAWQVIPPTMQMLVDDGTLSPLDTFDQATQDKAAKALMERAGLSKFMAGEMTAEAYADALAGVWAGLQGADGKGKYDGDKWGNKASVPFQDMVSALESWRASPESANDFSNATGWLARVPVADRARTYEWARARVEAENKAALAGERAAALTLAEDAIAEALDKGHSQAMPTPEQLRSLGVDEDNIADIQARFNSAQVFGQEIRARATTTFAQDQEYLSQNAEEVGGEGYRAETERQALREQAIKKKWESLEKDPWAYLTANEVVESPAPLDMSSPEALSSELNQRRAESRKTREMMGVPLPLFLKAETQSIQSILERAPEQQAAALVSNLGSVLSPAEKYTLAEDISKDSPMAAILLSVDPHTAGRIVGGMRLDVTAFKADDARTRVTESLNAYVLDPESISGGVDAVLAYMKDARLRTGNLAPDVTVEDKEIKAAITAIYGPQLDLGRRGKVFSYEKENGKFANKGEIQYILRNIDDSDLQAMGGMPIDSTGHFVTPDEIRSFARVASSSDEQGRDGHFLLMDDDMEVLLRQDGRPYLLDMRALEARQNARGSTYQEFLDNILRSSAAFGFAT